jgi:hypothetical protein
MKSNPSSCKNKHNSVKDIVATTLLEVKCLACYEALEQTPNTTLTCGHLPVVIWETKAIKCNFNKMYWCHAGEKHRTHIQSEVSVPHRHS